MSGPSLYASVSGWALGWALALVAMLAGSRSPFFIFWIALASAGLGLGAALAARARERNTEASRARLEGVAWGVSCFAVLLLAVLWGSTPPREELGKPGEINEVWITPNQLREIHERSVSLNPAMVRMFEVFFLFGVTAGLLSTAIRLGPRALASPLRCIGCGLAWGLAHVLVAYPLLISVYLLVYGMTGLFGRPGLYIGGALAGAFVGIIAGAIGESLTHSLIPRSPIPSITHSSID